MGPERTQLVAFRDENDEMKSSLINAQFVRSWCARDTGSHRDSVGRASRIRARTSVLLPTVLGAFTAFSMLSTPLNAQEISGSYGGVTPLRDNSVASQSADRVHLESAKAVSDEEKEPTQVSAAPIMVIAIGAAGLPEYGEAFTASAEAMMRVAQQAGYQWVCIGMQDEPQFSTDALQERYTAAEAMPELPTDDLGRLKRVISQIDGEADLPFWLVMFGHGTFDGRNARFNLRGPDISAIELAGSLESIRRPTVIVNCSSSSAPFLNALSRPGRIVITATRDGAEQNYSRFGSFFAPAFLSLDSDLDKDNQVSLLEAFLSATYRVAEFYESEKRLATEHALIDDNGDQLGTPYDWFVGVRVEQQTKSGVEPDGRRAHQVHLLPSSREEKMSDEQRSLRETLELKIDELRRQRNTMSEAEYLAELDQVAAQLADVYEIKLPDPPNVSVENSLRIETPQRNVQPPRPVDEGESNAAD